jgi:hypothetical protein
LELGLISLRVGPVISYGLIRAGPPFLVPFLKKWKQKVLTPFRQAQLKGPPTRVDPLDWFHRQCLPISASTFEVHQSMY